MKKILFSLMALVCSMSINAQIIKVLKNGEVVKTYTAEEADEVVFEKETSDPDPDPSLTTGTAKATIGGAQVDVPWVQLWENGPKFAVYNVGVTDGKAESFGGYYCWGGTIDKDPNGTYKTGYSDLTGEDDTATNLWGNKWRMPTIEEFKELVANCNITWTSDYKGDNSRIRGKIFTGKGDYASNSIFLPAAGYYQSGAVGLIYDGYYTSSTQQDNDITALFLRITEFEHLTNYNNYRDYGYSVRAVLAE